MKNIICTDCKSKESDVVCDAWVSWSDKEQNYVIHTIHDEWWCRDCQAYVEIEEIYEEDPADRDDRLYHEEQDHIAMEKAKENK